MASDPLDVLPSPAQRLLRAPGVPPTVWAFLHAGGVEEVLALSRGGGEIVAARGARTHRNGRVGPWSALDVWRAIPAAGPALAASARTGLPGGRA